MISNVSMSDHAHQASGNTLEKETKIYSRS